MRTKKFLFPWSCLTVLGLLLASCAPATAPAATPKPAAPAATKAPAAAPTTAPAAKPAAPAPKPAAPAATPKPAGEQPRYGGVLTIANGGEPPSLDIHREETTFTTSITSGTYNGIVKYDAAAWPESKVIGDLATSWEVSSDGKVYTFQFAKGVKWHDGAPFTSEDAKFTIERIRDPKLGLAVSPRRQWFTDVVSMETPDANTLKVTLKAPKASFLSLVAAEYNKVLPKHVATQKDMKNTIVGTGPFKFKEYTTGVAWELVKNPDYFVKGRPYLDGVKSYIILDSFTRFAALRTKSVLWMAPFPYMSVAQTKVIEQQLSDKIALEWGFHPAWYGVIFNLTKSPWSDARVRQAVTLSFDRKKMVAIGAEGAGVVAMAAQPPGEYTLPEEEMKKVPGYEKPDLEAAKKLMAEAGLAGGIKAEALLRGVKPHQDMGILAKDAMAQIGITLDFKVVETGVYKDLIFRKAFDINPLGWGVAVTDPDVSLGDYYVTGSSRNAGGYSNPKYDEMWAKQSATLDVAERKKIVWEMQRILLKDVPIALAYWVNVPYAWWKEVKGFKPPVSFINAFGGYPDMWISK